MIIYQDILYNYAYFFILYYFREGASNDLVKVYLVNFDHFLSSFGPIDIPTQEKVR